MVVADGTLIVGPPKAGAGLGIVALPGPLVPELQAHLATYCAAGAGALVFTGRRAGPSATTCGRQSGHRPAWPWGCHVANTLTAATGASTRELMHRMGHASPAAASATSTPRGTATPPSPPPSESWSPARTPR